MGKRTIALAEQVVATLTARGETLATCESLTAGLLAATIAEVPGASKVLRGGLVTYATETKTRLAGVPAELIDRFGVISEECAQAMAAGSRQQLGADWALSLTGVAGPVQVEGNPVGTVWLGIAGADFGPVGVRAESVDHYRYTLVPGHPTPVKIIDGDRNQVRAIAVKDALRKFLAVLDETSRG